MTDQNHEYSGIDTETEEENAAPQVELSPGLKNYMNLKDDAEKEEESEFDPKDLAKAENVAGGVLSGAEWAIEKWLGLNTGLSDQDKKQWAADVAPALVKMGVTDYTGFLDRYKVYITAIVATFKLGDKVAKNIVQQMAEAEAEKAQQDNQAPTPDEQPSGLEAYEKDLASGQPVMLGA